MKKKRVGQVVFIKKTNKKREKRDGKIHLVGYRTMIIYGIYQLPRHQLIVKRRHNQIEDIKHGRNNALVIILLVECGMFGLQSLLLPLPHQLLPRQVMMPMQNKYNYQMITTMDILNISHHKRHIIIYYQ